MRKNASCVIDITNRIEILNTYQGLIKDGVFYGG